MLQTSEGIWYSASDVLQWLGCAHRTTLDGRTIEEPALQAWVKAHKKPADLVGDHEGATAFESPAQFRGDQHERAMLQRLRDEGRSIVEIDRPAGYTADAIRAAGEDTRAAMKAGADVIFQATLLDAPWYGFADFLVRVDDVTSDLGNYAYEVRDTKLARHATASALIQMAHYGLIVEQWQGVEPPALRVWLGTGEEVPWSFGDAAPYLREARLRYLQTIQAKPATEPEPCSACGLCRWSEFCDEQWGPSDLTHVHRLTRIQRRQLREQGIATIEQLAAATAAPVGLAKQTFARLREQAVVQAGAEPFVLIRPQSRNEGLAKVPAPHPGDIYFDLEGDPFAGIPTLDYLWAYCDVSGDYAYRWAHDVEAERAAFLWFLELLEVKEDEGGDWHVYHYNSYELTSLRRVAADWPEPHQQASLVARVDSIIKRRFIDLYFIVENSLRTHKGTTSLKLIEKLAGYDRSAGAAADAVARADDSIKAYEQFILSTDEAKKAAILQGILDYNTHDVRATHAVHEWLFGLAATLAPEDIVEDDVEEYEQSDKVRVRIERTDELGARLRAAAQLGSELPSCLSATGAGMLADMLGWHRREMVVQYLDALRLEAWVRDGGYSDDSIEALATADAYDLGEAGVAQQTHMQRGTEHESCLLDFRLVSADAVPGKTVLRHTFMGRKGSWKVKAGDSVTEVLPLDADRKTRTFKLVDCDPESGSFVINAKEVPTDAIGFVKKETFLDGEVWESLMRLGEAALVDAPPAHHQIGLRALDAEAPVSAEHMAARAGEGAGARARRIAAEIECGVLPVQGPPGTGKTWLAARLIADQLRRDASSLIFVTANSHRVIDNLMRGASEHLREEGVAATFARVGSADKVDSSYGPVLLNTGSALPEWLDENPAGPRIVGATKYALCLSEVAGRGAMLFIDEAGQFTLADSLSVLQVAPVAVALGDPQQLSATVKAAHDESVLVSLLEHLSGAAAVIPETAGVFLDVSFRMHPAVCSVVAKLAYEGVLGASADAAARSISGAPLRLSSAELALKPGVHWIAVNGGIEAEAAAVVELAKQLRASATIKAADGSSGPLIDEELLVVAPHNSTVNRLRQLLPDSIRVGTVDKFQGQEGHVVIYALGRIAEEAGDVPFLFQLNRINVALSRARLMSIVVGAPDAIFPPVSTPEHLMLASRFIAAMGSA